MKKEIAKNKMGPIEKFSIVTTKAAGSSVAFVGALALIVIWGLTGPIFHYSETWQLVINTLTTIITFLMVFLIQKTQNKDSLAIQLKLNELVAAHEFASNRLINAENITEEELKVIQRFYAKLSDKAKGEESLQQSHSIDEATDMHELKKDIEENIRDKVRKNKD